MVYVCCVFLVIVFCYDLFPSAEYTQFTSSVREEDAQLKDGLAEKKEMT